MQPLRLFQSVGRCLRIFGFAAFFTLFLTLTGYAESKTVTESQQESFGNALEKQTLISTFDDQGLLSTAEYIRYKKIFFYEGAEKKVRSESFDIVKQSANGKMTREIIIYNYHSRAQTLKKVYRAFYEQMGTSPFAKLNHYLLQTYDPRGFLSHTKEWLPGPGVLSGK